MSDSRENSATNRCFNRLFLAGDVATVSSFGSLTSDTAEAVLNLRRQYPPIYRICRGIELFQEVENG